MGTGLRAGVIATVLAGVAQTAGSQQEQFFRAELRPVGEQVGQGNVFFSDEQSLQSFQQRLNDPAQRLALRAEYLASMEGNHPDFAEVVGIDAATQQKFFDLLADQHLQRLAEFAERARPHGPSGPDWLQGVADSQTKVIEAQREVLGAEGLERHRDYMDTLGARLEVVRLDARLASGQKLQPGQKARLISLINEHEPLRKQMSTRTSRAPLVAAASGTDAQSRLALFDVAGHMEDLLKSMMDADRAVLARAGEFLTAPQLTALESMRTEKVSNMRRHIEQTRAQAGTSAAAPAERAAQRADDNGLEPLAGDIKVEISIAVNDGKPALLTHTGPNGQAVEVEVDGLLVEVKSTVYERDFVDTQFAYYEQGSNGRRLIGSGAQAGASASRLGSFRGGGGSTVIMGTKKAYAVTTSVVAGPL